MRKFLLLILGILLIAAVSYFFTDLLIQPSRTRLAEATQLTNSLAQQEAALTRRLGSHGSVSDAPPFPAEIYWSGTERSAIGLEMQKTLLDLIDQAQLDVLSFGLGNTEADISELAVSFDLELQGGHQEVGEFLRLVENLEPPLAISYLWARQLPADPSHAVAPMTLRLTMWEFGGGAGDVP